MLMSKVPHCAPYAVAVREIANDADCGTTCRIDAFNDSFAPRLVDVEDANECPLTRKTSYCSMSDSTGTTGHDHSLTLESG